MIEEYDSYLKTIKIAMLHGTIGLGDPTLQHMKILK